MKQRLVIATNNAHKLEEITAVVGDKFEIVSLADIDCHEDIPETADTLEGNALLKARFVHERYGLDVFADDTGLEVDALGGQPGVHTARYAYPDRNDNEANVDKLLRELQGATNRKAHFRTVIALIIGGEEHLFEGRVDGHITETRRGTEGFGYDPVFSPEDTGEDLCGIGCRGEKSPLAPSTCRTKVVRLPRTTRSPLISLPLMKKCFALLVLGLLFVGSPTAQGALPDRWTPHLAYHDGTACATTGSYLYALMGENLLIYDTENDAVAFVDRVSAGLSDKQILHIGYSQTRGWLVLLYRNGNIDLYRPRDGQLVNLRAIKQAMNENLTVNQLRVQGDDAFVTTNKGFVWIDLTRAEIKGISPWRPAMTWHAWATGWRWPPIRV